MHLKSVKHVICYLSGGVGSSVAALLLKRKGFYITGVFLENKYEDRETIEKKKEKAYETCKALSLPLREVKLSDGEWSNFNKSVIRELEQRGIPDLDVLFHKHVLFGSLFDSVMGNIGADFVATGHFARTTVGEHIDKWTKLQGSKLMKSVDLRADESYLLSPLPQASLQKLYFPLGDFHQEVMSKVVEATELKPILSDVVQEENAHFINKNMLFETLKQDIPNTKGRIVHFQTGCDLGEHQGLHTCVLGQPVKAGDQTYYLSGKDQQTNEIKVVSDINHPSLLHDVIFTDLPHWSHKTPYHFFEKKMMNADFRLYNGQPLTKCVLTVGNGNEWCGCDHVIVSSSRPIRAVDPGHMTALYDGEECLGSARISRTGPSHYDMNYRRDYSVSLHSGKHKPTDTGSSSVKTFFKKVFPSFKT